MSALQDVSIGLQRYRQRVRGGPVRAVDTTAALTGLAVGAAILIVALLYRLFLLHNILTTVDSDQAVLGIMARHIVAGDRPIFFYGQGYQGALEAYATAGVFALWGQSDLTLRLVPALVSIVCVAQLTLLAQRLYGRPVAVVTALWLALPSPVLAYWGTTAGAGYIEVMVCGNALLLVAVRRWGLGRPRRYDLPSLGLLTGLGVWLQPVIAYYLVTLSLTTGPLIWRAHRHSPPLPVRSLLRRALPPLACLLLGAAPWLLYSIEHPGASVAVLSGHATLAALGDALGRLVWETLPVLAGGALSATVSLQFAAYINGHPLLYALTLLLLVYVVVALLRSPGGLLAQGRALLRGRPLSDAPLALLPLVSVALYLTSRFATLSWTTHNPRYLLPIYTATPYLIACLLPLRTAPRAARRRRRWLALAAWVATVPPPLRGVATLYLDGARVLARHAAAIVLTIALAMNVYGTLQFQGEQPITRLAAALEGRGDGAVYALYWLAWRLAFESSERLVPVVTQGLEVDTHPNGNRYPPYLATAAQARRWAYLLPYGIGTSDLQQRLHHLHVPYRRWQWGSIVIIDGLSSPAFPPRCAACAGAW